MRGPNRQRRPGRREPFRDPRPIVLIVCEGEETEKQYFEKFALHHKNSRIRTPPRPRGQGNSGREWYSPGDLEMLAHTVGEPGRNPTTNVYELTELILKGPGA